MTGRKKISRSAIQELDGLLLSIGHHLITEATDPVSYAKCIDRWSSAAVKPAGAALIPETEDAIVTAIRYATQHNIDLAVRGGGHSTAGSSSTRGGLLIDLGSSAWFKQVTVDKSKNHIVAGGGAQWGHVDDAGFAAGLVTVGGTVNDTGIGGLTLGGGYGWLSGKLGLTIDNLVSVRLITADGSILEASAEHNQELFWGVRGAGQNFGVAVQFVYQGYPYGTGPVEERVAGAENGQAYAGMLTFSVSSLSPVLGALNRLFGPEGSLKGGTGASGFALARSPVGKGTVILVVPVVWLGDGHSERIAFQELLELSPTAEDLKMMDYPGINRIFRFEHGIRISMKGCSYNVPIREAFVRKLLDSYTKFTEEVPDAWKCVLQFDLLDMTKVVTRASNQDMAFGNRGYHLNAAAEVFWRDPANDEVCRNWARDVATIFKAEIKRKGEDLVGSKVGEASKKSDLEAVMMYGNLDQYDEKAHDLFGANLPRLRQLKARYDPTNTFDKHFGIPLSV